MKDSHEKKKYQLKGLEFLEEERRKGRDRRSKKKVNIGRDITT